MENVIAIGKNQVCFTVMEPVKGALVDHTAVNANKVGYFLTSGEGSINQELEMLDDKQIRGGRSKRNPIRGRFNAGKYSFPTYVKPILATSDTDYANIMETHHLFQALTGGTPVFSGTSVKYTLANVLPTFNLWIKKDHTLFVGIGATVNTLKVDAKGSDVGSLNWDGEFMKMLYAGTGEVATSAVLGATSIVVDDASKYNMVPMVSGGSTVEKGLYIKLSTESTVFQITGIDYTTNTLTLDTALTADAPKNTSVTPWIPENSGATAYVERGEAIHGKLGLVQMGAAGAGVEVGDAFPVLDINVTITNNVKYATDEKDGSMYANDFFTSDFRSVDGSANIYFRTNDVKYFKKALKQDKLCLTIPLGVETGKKFLVYLPHVEVKTPNISGENEQNASVSFNALMYAQVNDELEIVIK